MPYFIDAALVGQRLGRDLTAEETAIANGIIESITLQIATAVDRDADWAAALEPVPALFVAICTEKALAGVTNPRGTATTSETLGAYTRSETYPRSNDIGAVLSDREELLIRRAWFGGNAASARLRSGADDVLDMRDNLNLDDSVDDPDNALWPVS